MTPDELEQMRADAERYRYLCQYRGWPEDIEAALECGSKDLIDAAIDAHIACDVQTTSHQAKCDNLHTAREAVLDQLTREAQADNMGYDKETAR